MASAVHACVRQASLVAYSGTFLQNHRLSIARSHSRLDSIKVLGFVDLKRMELY
jgi:hypothetical protein